MDEDESRYTDKLELVYQEYERSLDLDIALELVPLSEAEKMRLMEDPDLYARIVVCDARVKQDLMRRVRAIAEESDSDGVRLTALKELGRTLYPKRFKDDGSNGNVAPRVIKYEAIESTIE